MASKDEDVLAAMANVARTRTTEPDPRLERYARRELTDAETASLHAEAERDPDLARDVALYAPLSEAGQSRLYAAAAAGLRPQRQRLWWASASTLALAAAAAGVFVFASPSALPAYELQVRGHDATYRGADRDADRRALRADSELELVLRPTVAVDDVEASLFVGSGSTFVASSIAPERSSDGAFRWRGTAAALTGQTQGDVVLVAIVARPGYQPLPAAVSEKPAKGPGWQSARVHVLIRPVADPSD